MKIPLLLLSLFLFYSCASNKVAPQKAAKFSHKQKKIKIQKIKTSKIKETEKKESNIQELSEQQIQSSPEQKMEFFIQSMCEEDEHCMKNVRSCMKNVDFNSQLCLSRVERFQELSEKCKDQIERKRVFSTYEGSEECEEFYALLPKEIEL